MLSSVPPRVTPWFFLASLPFLAISGLLLHTAATPVLEWHRTRNWPVVPATVLTTRLDQRIGSEVAEHRVFATYRYVVGGVAHTGTRVSIYPVDYHGTFLPPVHRRLEAARVAGQTVPAHVNPSRPEESVLSRDLQTGLLAATLGGAALMAMPLPVLGLLVYQRRRPT
jgi:hypothetical protein